METSESESFTECFGDHFCVFQYQGRKKFKVRRIFWRSLSCISIPGSKKWKWKFQIMFWGSLSIPGRKAPRLHFRWEWIFCNPFTWKMHCDEKPKLALRSETKRKTFCIYFVIFLYLFCYVFVLRLLYFCISFYNPLTWNMYFYEKPKLALRSETKRKTFCISAPHFSREKKHSQSVQNDDIVVDITHLRWRAFYLFNWNNVHKMACALLEMGQGTICNVAVSSSKKQTPKTNNCNQEYQPMTTIPTTIKLINPP